MTGQLIYRKGTLLQILDISETTLRRWMNDDGFPRPKQLGPRAVGWLAVDVTTWLEARPVALANGEDDDA